MKKLFYTILVSVLFVTGAFAQSKLDRLNLSGTVTDESARKIYLQRYENKSFYTVDSTEVIDGKFFFDTEVLLPEIYGLSLNGTAINPFDSFIVFLDNQAIQVFFDASNSFKNTKVTGSKEQDILTEIIKQRGKPIQEILSAYPGSLAALYYLYRYQSFRLTPTELRQSLTVLDPSFENTAYVQVLKELANNLEGIGIGNRAPNFAAHTESNRAVELSDYLGTGYVLIDFWASWCPPCRAENPHLLKVYEEYSAKGFEIIGVSLDKKVEPWLQAIAQDGLPWKHVYDPKAWAGDAVVKYGVRLIPSNFLIDPNGVIIDINLKGEALDKKLAELF